MQDDVRFGLLLPTREAMLGAGWEACQLLALSRDAERLGLASVWVGEQLARARLEAFTTLAAVSAVTERVTLGTAALLPAIREPLMAAQAIATLDQLCRGRLVLGLGAGFPERSLPEFTLTGAPYDTRYARLADIAKLWRALWSDQPPASFHGSTLHLDQLPELPRPRQPRRSTALARQRRSRLARARWPRVRRLAALPARASRLRDRPDPDPGGCPGCRARPGRDRARPVRNGACRGRRGKSP
jgi:alkanesulfonate monooxygenase SsuD/methylene tetrahydromethanopterin reductase-like flavin-dependent oxidoreductase (luciferase family)